jgi:hypothetical protein
LGGGKSTISTLPVRRGFIAGGVKELASSNIQMDNNKLRQTNIKISDEQVKICSTENVKPEFGYCAATKTHYFGYKLHAICDANAMMHSFDFTPANVHDVNYFKEVKYALSNCELIGDKSYINAPYQAYLFNQNQIKLSVPTRNNSLVKKEYLLNAEQVKIH